MSEQPSIQRDQLLQQRNQLLARLALIKADYRRGLSADSGERAVELENTDVLTEIQRVTQLRLQTVERQLADLTS